MKYLIWSRNFFYLIYIATVFNDKAKHILQNIDFFVLFLGVLVIFPSVFSCHCVSIISNKYQTFNPTISTSPPYSGLKTRHIVIYVTIIKHWIEFSMFSSKNFAVGQKILEICRMKFCGWQKILIFAGIKFHDLAKKLRNCEIFWNISKT